jgi:hypothetical protein
MHKSVFFYPSKGVKRMANEKLVVTSDGVPMPQEKTPEAVDKPGDLLLMSEQDRQDFEPFSREAAGELAAHLAMTLPATDTLPQTEILPTEPGPENLIG